MTFLTIAENLKIGEIASQLSCQRFMSAHFCYEINNGLIAEHPPSSRSIIIEDLNLQKKFHTLVGCV